jgi:energy-coupling factor transporter ATP-binding protein EcfA2
VSYCSRADSADYEVQEETREMKTARLTIKNYRGFADATPAKIEISGGLTALLGPNNAGKSSLKLFFYEMRPLFQQLLLGVGHSPSLFTLMDGQSFSFGCPGTSDAAEIFNNVTNRDISIEIEVVDPTKHPIANHTINKLVATCERATPQQWKARVYSLQSPSSPVFSDNGYVAQSDGLIADRHGTVFYDFGELREIIQVFFEARYFGAFRNALNQGSGSYYDFMIGTAFIDLWNNWKTSGVRSHSRAIEKITEDIRSLFEFERLEINASVSLKTLLVTINGHQYRLAEMGSGISQFIMALGNAATAAPSLILIDEPETNLHPALQVDFLLTLAQYAKVGCIFSTHSVGLARSVAHPIFTVQRGAQGPIVRPFEATPSYTQFLGELSFSSFKEMGCDRILLVEGVNDVKAIQQLLRLFGKEHTTVILPLGGDQLVTGAREYELNELRRLSGNIFAVVDSERPGEGAGAAERRMAFGEVCKKVGFDLCLTERRAIENYFSDYAVKAAFGPSFEQLQPYERLDDHPNGWSKSDNWRIARHVRKADLLLSDVGAFLDRI